MNENLQEFESLLTTNKETEKRNIDSFNYKTKQKLELDEFDQQLLNKIKQLELEEAAESKSNEGIEIYSDSDSVDFEFHKVSIKYPKTPKKTVKFDSSVTQILETKDSQDTIISVDKTMIPLSDSKKEPEIKINPVKEFVVERVIDSESECESDGLHSCSEESCESDVDYELLGKHVSLEYHRKTQHFIDAGYLKRL
jgi:hypothetical protein